jgi:hypothetical protein
MPGDLRMRDICGDRGSNHWRHSGSDVRQPRHRQCQGQVPLLLCPRFSCRFGQNQLGVTGRVTFLASLRRCCNSLPSAIRAIPSLHYCKKHQSLMGVLNPSKSPPTLGQKVRASRSKFIWNCETPEAMPVPRKERRPPIYHPSIGRGLHRKSDRPKSPHMAAARTLTMRAAGVRR